MIEEELVSEDDGDSDSEESSGAEYLVPKTHVPHAIAGILSANDSHYYFSSSDNETEVTDKDSEAETEAEARDVLKIQKYIRSRKLKPRSDNPRTKARIINTE